MDKFIVFVTYFTNEVDVSIIKMRVRGDSKHVYSESFWTQGFNCNEPQDDNNKTDLFPTKLKKVWTLVAYTEWMLYKYKL